MSGVDIAALQSLARRVDAAEYKGVWIIFHDYNTRSCSKWIPPAAFHSALVSGGVFARANLNFTIDDQQAVQPRFGADTGDFLAIPDPETLSSAPLQPGIGQVFSYLHTEDGELWEGCPRGRLDAMVQELADRGFSARVAFEPEFSLFREDADGALEPADRAMMYSTERINTYASLLHSIERALADQDVRVIQIGSEYGAGQIEINLQHQSPLAAADATLRLRDTVKVLAADAGLHAVFMPKPHEDMAGNGLHVHFSLQNVEDDEDCSTGDGPAGLSDELLHFLGGVLAHARALTGVGAPTANSYRRLQPASWAPAHVAWAESNRAALVRIPGKARRHLEFRAADHTCNPYLFLTALLAAGIDGLDRKLDPGSPASGDLGRLSLAELRAQGVEMLPRSAGEALDAIEQDDVVMTALGPVCGPELLRVKREELARIERHVSELERSIYLRRV